MAQGTVSRRKRRVRALDVEAKALPRSEPIEQQFERLCDSLQARYNGPVSVTIAGVAHDGTWIYLANVAKKASAAVMKDLAAHLTKPGG